jgi:hypothetical protein
MPRGGFSPDHLSYASGASMVDHLKVVEIPPENGVI